MAAFVLTALAVWLSVRKVDFRAVRDAFVGADYLLVVAAAIVSLCAVLIISVRWRLLLRTGGEVPLGRIARITMVSQCVNILAPGRFGELAKAFLVARGSPFTPAFALGTVAVEKTLDLLVFLALWAIVPVFFPLREIVREQAAALVFIGFVLAVLAFFVFWPGFVMRAARRALRLLPSRFRSRGEDFAAQGVEAFGALRNVRLTSALAGLTLLTLVFEILPNWFLLRAFNLDVPFWASVFVFIVLLMGKLPPSLPGKIGIYQFSVILALVPFGVGRDEALGYGIMLHAVTFIPRIILGLIFAAGFGAVTWRDGPAQTAPDGAHGGAGEGAEAE